MHETTMWKRLSVQWEKPSFCTYFIFQHNYSEELRYVPFLRQKTNNIIMMYLTMFFLEIIHPGCNFLSTISLRGMCIGWICSPTVPSFRIYKKAFSKMKWRIWKPSICCMLFIVLRGLAGERKSSWKKFFQSE